MFALSPDGLVSFLAASPPEAVWLVQLLVCFGAIVGLARLFGASGLHVYIAVAIIGANLQVLKPVQFGLFDHPVALGTVLFSSTYLATDLLAERYGPAAARQGVYLGFAAYLLWTVLGIATLGFRPLTAAEAGADLAWAVGMHDHMAALFTPAPALFVAGMVAYLTSQLGDIWLYQALRARTQGRHMWLRNNASTAISGLVDNTVFSVLAWVVLAPEPVGLVALLWTYILGTYAIRLVVAALDTPFLYLARGLLADGTGDGRLAAPV